MTRVTAGDTGDRTPAVRLVDALADLVAAVRARHPDVPRLDPVVAELPHARRATAHAHRFTLHPQARAGGQDHAADAVFSLVIDLDVVARGAVEVLNAVLHSAAHAANSATGRADTSREGRYHNGEFRTAALALDLAVDPDTRDGWAITRVPDATAAAYRPVLDALTGAITAYGPPAPAADSSPASGSNDRWLTATCGCTPVRRRIRVARSVLEAAPIVCGACEQAFRLVAPGAQATAG
ncbi:MAG: hypothetical protein HOV94_39120 [Saccharothrix sp.]|nr:hypothetical protein [Saccharothrix sp.]